MSEDQKPETKRKRYELLRSQLELERSSFIPHWRDLSDYILPRRSRFLMSDVNKGDRRNTKIIDSTATTAARTLRSGMMGGVTSPARPWFRLTTPDPELSEYAPVKEWLHVVSQRMANTFLKSNLYNTLPITYGDIGVFATNAMSIEEDFDNVIHTRSFPIGSYMIANDERGRVNTFIRDFRMTVRQIVSRFGTRDEKTGKVIWDNFSDYVKCAYERGEYETWVDVCHVIEPNPDYDPKKLDSKFKKFSSCYYERGNCSAGRANYVTGKDDDKYLSEKGYDYFPILCPRWEVTGEDVYGTSCPGIDSLGDIKALQIMQKRKAQAIEKMVNPPMVGPTSLRSVKTSILPGDITYSDEREGQRGFRPAHEVNPRIQELLMDVEDHRKRIQRVFFEDLFLMLANSDRREITAREIDERHEEKLLALGPVLEQLNQDLLDPLIENTFNIMLRQSNLEAGTGLIPKPPEEIAGVDLKVEYTSIMAQAQKMIGIGAIERLAQFGGQIAAFDPRAAKKIKWDQMVDEYSEALGASPRVIRTDDEVEEMMAAEAKAAQAQQRAEMIQQGSVAAKNLSQTDLEGNNALTALMNQSKAGALVQQ